MALLDTDGLKPLQITAFSFQPIEESKNMNLVMSLTLSELCHEQ